MESRVSRTSAVRAHIERAEVSVTRYGWKALAGSVTGFSMDGFDMLILGFMLPAISSALALTSTQAGSLVTWTMLGAVVGGLIFGTLSDEHTSELQSPDHLVCRLLLEKKKKITPI